MPSDDTHLLVSYIHKLERRIKKLEKYSHKQPDMKEMLRDAMDLLEAAAEKKTRDEKKKIIAAHDKNKATYQRKIQRSIKRPPGVRC